MSERADQAVSALTNEVFLANAALLRAGDGLTGDLSLSAARWLILGALQDGPVSIADVGRIRGLRRQSARESVQRLERDGLLTHQDDPRDRRAPLLALTPAGREALDRIEPRRAAWAAGVAEALDPAELERAAVLLRALRAHLEV